MEINDNVHINNMVDYYRDQWLYWFSIINEIEFNHGALHGVSPLDKGLVETEKRTFSKFDDWCANNKIRRIL